MVIWTPNLSAHASGDGRTLLDRIETSTAPTTDSVVTFDSAVRWLRAQGAADDLTVLECLHGAVEEAESFCNRTFRKSITRTVYYRGWRSYLPIPLPPLQSITSVKYYDISDVLQTVSASDYSVQTPTRGPGKVSFQMDFNFPNVNTDRSDPVEVICVTGWGTEAQIPPVAKTAIRMLVEALYDGMPAKRTEARRIMQSLVYRGRP
jgi:hypothetical protein